MSGLCALPERGGVPLRPVLAPGAGPAQDVPAAVGGAGSPGAPAAAARHRRAAPAPAQGCPPAPADGRWEGGVVLTAELSFGGC